MNRVTVIRENVEESHQQWFDEAVTIANRLNIKIAKPRMLERQTIRDNHPADAISNFY